MKSALALVILVASVGCGGASGSSADGPRFTITSPGGGEANLLPLLPLAVGDVTPVIDDGGTSVVDAILEASGGRLYRAVSASGTGVQLYLVNDDGVFAAGNADSGRLAHPVLIAPRVVRDGMTWDVFGDSGDLVLSFTARASGAATWTITARPADPTLAANVETYVEGRGLMGDGPRLVVQEAQPPAAIARIPVAMSDPQPGLDTISLGHMSMVRRPDGTGILVTGGSLFAGGQSVFDCFTTDGNTITRGSFVSGAPFQTSRTATCAESVFEDTNEGGTSVTYPVLSEQGASAFVAADGTVYYFARSESGSPILANTGEISLGGNGYIGLFFLPGAGGVPSVVVNTCTPGPGCNAPPLNQVPFDHLFQDLGTPLPYTWGALGPIAEITPIRDDEGGTSLLLRTRDGMLWTSAPGGTPVPGARLPGLLSVQAQVGGNEVLRVLADSSVDRLHVSHGRLSVEHLADAVLPPAEHAESAFLWHEPAGDHLLVVSTLYDGFQLGQHGRFRWSLAPIAAGPTIPLPAALAIGETAIGNNDVLLCGAPGADPPAATGWSEPGKALPVFPQAGTSCAIVVDADATPGGLGELSGNLPGLGTVNVAVANLPVNGLGGAIDITPISRAVFTALRRPVVAPLAGDGAVTRFDRLGPGAIPAIPPALVALDDGIADRGGHGLWIATAAGVALLGATDLPIAGTAGMRPILAVAGGGVIASGAGSLELIGADGVVHPVAALPADHTPLAVLADGTVCGKIVNDSGEEQVFCRPQSGAERTAGWPGHEIVGEQRTTLAVVALADGGLFVQEEVKQIVGSDFVVTQESYVIDLATMAVTDLGPITDVLGAPIYGVDGTAYAFVARTFRFGKVDRAGFTEIPLHDRLGVGWDAATVTEHLFLVSRPSGDFARLPRDLAP